MVVKSTKPASKKVASAKTKTKTNSATSSNSKSTKAATTTKKIVAKKTVVAAPKAKKSKTSTVKKVSVSPAKPKMAAKKNSVIKAKPSTAAIKSATKLTPEERYRMVETAAYFIAEKHGFQGRSDEHWAAAERQIAVKLGQ
jgi:hypothetical protein